MDAGPMRVRVAAGIGASSGIGTAVAWHSCARGRTSSSSRRRNELLTAIVIIIEPK
jgi:NADP-dependent 3-hydroxy acid dehydrogenase YdfG